MLGFAIEYSFFNFHSKLIILYMLYCPLNFPINSEWEQYTADFELGQYDPTYHMLCSCLLIIETRRGIVGGGVGELLW